MQIYPSVTAQSPVFGDLWGLEERGLQPLLCKSGVKRGQGLAAEVIREAKLPRAAGSGFLEETESDWWKGGVRSGCPQKPSGGHGSPAALRAVGLEGLRPETEGKGGPS